MIRYAVILNSGTKSYAFGPLDDIEYARQFAAFMTREVDPAQAVTLMDPIDELLRYEKRNEGLAKDTTAERPPYWPPTPGEIWEDRDGNRWACARVPNGHPYLTCLARAADDSAEEIWRLFGPMTRVALVAPTQQEEEIPF